MKTTTDDCFHGSMKFDEEIGDYIHTCEVDGCRDSRCPFNQQENARFIG